MDIIKIPNLSFESKPSIEIGNNETYCVLDLKCEDNISFNSEHPKNANIQMQHVCMVDKKGTSKFGIGLPNLVTCKKTPRRREILNNDQRKMRPSSSSYSKQQQKYLLQLCCHQNIHRNGLHGFIFQAPSISRQQTLTQIAFVLRKHYIQTRILESFCKCNINSFSILHKIWNINAWDYMKTKVLGHRIVSSWLTSPQNIKQIPHIIQKYEQWPLLRFPSKTHAFMKKSINRKCKSYVRLQGLKHEIEAYGYVVIDDAKNGGTSYHLMSQKLQLYHQNVQVTNNLQVKEVGSSSLNIFVKEKKTRETIIAKMNSMINNDSYNITMYKELCKGVLKRKMVFAQKEVVPNYNKDFIVTSSLNENLMLIIALKKRKKKKQYHLGNQFLKGKDLQLVMKHNNSNNYLGKMDVVPRQHVFVGHFTAFSSFLGFRLGQEAHRVRYESNAGGTSTISEV
jgi:hypothetical protein